MLMLLLWILGRQRELKDYNNPEELYANKSAILLFTLQKTGFELNPAYISVMGHHRFYGIPHEDPIDHLESFKDLA